MTVEIHPDRWEQIRCAAEKASQLGEPALLIVAIDLFQRTALDSDWFENWLATSPTRDPKTPDLRRKVF